MFPRMRAWTFSFAVSNVLLLNNLFNDSSYVLYTDSIGTTWMAMPRLRASAQASSRLPRDENCDGIAIPVTCSLPSASTAMAAVTAESIPPERPITTSLKPHLSM
jgi:hypothetical protein